MIHEIYSIGYAAFSIGEFVNALLKHGINAIADVRSQPYSRFKPEFNRDNLRRVLRTHNIGYVFLGDECGARIGSSEYYVNGKVSFDLVKDDKGFQRGLRRLRKGAGKYRLAIMCAEKDPIMCHRTILICRNLRSPDIVIKHIIENGFIEDHSDTEKRLLRIHNLDRSDLYSTYGERLEEAYSRQGEKIAYNPLREPQERSLEY